MAYRAFIDRNAIGKLRKEGRGKGTLQDYKPWLTVRDVPSLGRSYRDLGWKTGRTHHFLSTLELLYYFTLEWSPMVIDIREQYPLLSGDDTIDETLAIAESFDIKHPVHPKTKEPIVLTTDFYLSLRNQSGTFEHARTVKYAKDLSNRRTIEKLEIERRYWEVKGIDWGIVTEHEIPLTLAKNVDLLHDAWYLPSFMPFDNIFSVTDSLTRLVTERNQPLNELTSLNDKQLNLKGGISLKVAYYLLATRQWQIDMNVPIDPEQPLTVLGTNLKAREENG